MNPLLKCCLGYVTLSNVFMKSSAVLSRHELEFLKNFNVTLRSHPLSSFYRFPRTKFPKQYYDAFLALDFEASTARIFTTITEQEIIEFPCVWIDAKNMRVIKTFHRYVRPVLHPVLDPFCTQLTGITTEMLEKEKPFVEVFNDFQNWYGNLSELTGAKKTLFITCGDWDLKVMLPKQCKLSKVPVPRYMRHWVNIKESYNEVSGRYPKHLKEMVMMLNLKKVGRLHRGIDDTRNVVNIARELASRGHVFIS